MRTYYQGPQYTVEFSDEDTTCFTHYTDASPDEVHGSGSFVFDSLSGDLLKVKGAARGHEDSMEWLAFSQDAQDQAREELARHGVQVNPYTFVAELPELSDPAKAKKHAGAKPEIGRPVIMRNPGQCPLRVNAGTEGVIANIDDAGVVYVDWENGESAALDADDDWEMPPAWNPRISRTRGVKTMKGPYSATKGYKPWIRRRGKLGEGFLTTMSKDERHKSLDRCVRGYGYRSCLGSIMVLERAKKGPRGKGEGVGVKYAGKLRESREYLKRKYGGEGSFKREEKKKKKARKASKAAEAGAAYMANPAAAEHARRAHAYLQEGQDAMRRGLEHFRRAKAGGLQRATVGHEIDSACAYARDGQRFALLAKHEIDDAGISGADARHFHEAAEQLSGAAHAMLNELECAWAS